ncbi:hypothetical protein GGD70_007981 [Paraburkholderia fungorum]|nr:hypothetical protein [Paraburkholderia fungorum]
MLRRVLPPDIFPKRNSRLLRALAADPL